jgi:hypothetical protein
MYKTTMDAQKGMYAMYFKKNGLQNAREVMKAVVEALVKRDSGTAGSLLLSSMESVISGPTSILS